MTRRRQNNTSGDGGSGSGGGGDTGGIGGGGRGGGGPPPPKRSRSTESKGDAGAAGPAGGVSPWNRDGYRYALAERDLIEPLPKGVIAFRPCGTDAPAVVTLSLHDRAPQLRLSSDRMSVTGDKGYCMARASHGVRHGTWYYEVTISHVNFTNGGGGGVGGVGGVDSGSSNATTAASGSGSGSVSSSSSTTAAAAAAAKTIASYPSSSGGSSGTAIGDAPAPHCRVGWSQKYADLQVPCGFDCFSYSWRDINGTRFHVSRGQPYGGGHVGSGGGDGDGGGGKSSDGASEGVTTAAYGAGDVLGLLITLPPSTLDPSSYITPPDRSRQPMRWRNKYTLFEENDVQDKARLRVHKGSCIEGFLNGVSQGVMFQDIYEGTYYPAVSLYYGCTATLNFGPDFKHAPPERAGARPMCEAVHRTNAELALLDILSKAELRAEQKQQEEKAEEKKAKKAEEKAEEKKAKELIIMRQQSEEAKVKKEEEEEEDKKEEEEEKEARQSNGGKEVAAAEEEDALMRVEVVVAASSDG